MSTPQMTTAEALRSALASTITCSAQELQEAVGQLVVATSAECCPDAGPDVRSLSDPQTRTTVLLADRIPAGQEAAAVAREIERHHGRQAAQTVIGDLASELVGSSDGAAGVGLNGRSATLSILKQKQIGVSDLVLAADSLNPQIKVAIGTFEGTSGGEWVQLRLLHVLRGWGNDGHGRPDDTLVQAVYAGLGNYSDFNVQSIQKITAGDVAELVKETASALLARLNRQPLVENGLPVTWAGSDRWTFDRGAMPGEPFAFLDGDSESCVAAMVEVLTPGKPAIYEVRRPGGSLLSQTDFPSEAARAAEERLAQENGVSKRTPAQLLVLARGVSDVALKGYSESVLKEAEQVLRGLPGSVRVDKGLAVLKKALEGAEYVHHDLQDVSVGLAQLAQGKTFDGDEALDADADADEAEEVEYGVNVALPGGGQHNPFDQNFATLCAADEAGRGYLRSNPELSEVTLFELSITGDQISGDLTVGTITRADLEEPDVAPVANGSGVAPLRDGAHAGRSEPSGLAVIPAASDISTAPRDRVILTDCGLAKYVDQRGWGSPVENGWYLCEPSGFISSCAENGMSISMIDPKRWMEFAPIEEHLAGDAPVAKSNPFVTSETVHRAQVSYFWTKEKLHETDYQIKVSDAVYKAVEKAVQKHDVVQNTSFACQWEGVEFEGESLAAVTAAANDVAKVLGRFKGVRPLWDEPENAAAPKDASPSPGM